MCKHKYEAGFRPDSEQIKFEKLKHCRNCGVYYSDKVPKVPFWDHEFQVGESFPLTDGEKDQLLNLNALGQATDHLQKVYLDMLHRYATAERRFWNEVLKGRKFAPGTLKSYDPSTGRMNVIPSKPDTGKLQLELNELEIQRARMLMNTAIHGDVDASQRRDDKH